MKKGIVFAAVCLWGVFSSSAMDKTLLIGGEAGWDSLQSSENVRVVPGRRGFKDLTLSNGGKEADVSTDLLLHFDSLPIRDETERYRVSAGASFKINEQSPQIGQGCAAFSGPGSAVTVRAARSGGPDAPFFSRRSEAGDLTIEFWLYPANLETGETIFKWQSLRTVGKRSQSQLASCAVENGHLVWRFVNVFVSPKGSETSFTLEGKNPSTPRKWSHHMVRFDSSTGMIEYLVDGVTEDTTFANDTGRENGIVFLPETGAAAPLVIGGSYIGFLDEFRIGFTATDPGRLSKFQDKSGGASSKVFDLGYTGSTITKIDAHWKEPGSTGVDFLCRAGDQAATWTDVSPEWLPFKPGSTLNGIETGRYVQIAVRLYPDGTGKQAPTISDITIHYEEALPPPPPSALIAIAGNGTVTLKWKSVPDSNVKGYTVYYGYAPGEYFGTDADMGRSPIDAGDVTKLVIGGLENGKLYYFAVAAYDGAEIPHASDFSPEAFARPSRLEN